MACAWHAQVPGHFNDPGIIERTPSPQDRYWSARALFVHGIKRPTHFETASRRWTLDRDASRLTLNCERPCAGHGTEGYKWDWARLPCPTRRWDSPPHTATGRFCDVAPSHHYRCCAWPWVVPELRDAVLSVLADVPRSASLGTPAIVRRTRRRVARQEGATSEGCGAACARPEVPGGAFMQAVLDDLAARGDIVQGADGGWRLGARQDV